MRNKLWLTLVALVIMDGAPSSFAKTTDLNQIKQTCVCKACDLSHLQLNHFTPNQPQLLHNKIKQMCYLHCDFSQSNLTNANLKDSNFTTCQRGYVTSLATATFAGANLSQADLQNAIFYGVNFNGVNFTQANLSNVKLGLCDFKSANFTRANLAHAVCTRDAMHGWGCDLRQANFTQANLEHASLHANFHQANFSGANLTAATLTTSEDAVPLAKEQASFLWNGVNFTQANLHGAVLKTMNNSATDLSKAIFCHTIMPDGHVSNRDCHHD